MALNRGLASPWWALRMGSGIGVRLRNADIKRATGVFQGLACPCDPRGLTTPSLPSRSWYENDRSSFSSSSVPSGVTNERCGLRDW